MSKLKYTIIKNTAQYQDYCNLLENLIDNGSADSSDEIELLTLLIEKWDSEHNTLIDSDPVSVLKYLMDEHNLKAIELAEIVKLSKGTISKIINYQKGISKETIRKLSEYFKVNQEVFNRPYTLSGKTTIRKNITPISRKYKSNKQPEL